VVSGSAGQTSGGGPPAVAVHDHGDVQAFFAFEGTLHYKVTRPKKCTC